MLNAEDLVQEEHIVFSNKIAEESLKLYDLSPSASAVLLNCSENTTYLVEDPERQIRRILRVNRPGYHTKAELEAELVWLEALGRSSSIVVPQPIAGKNGEYVQTLQNRMLPWTQHCVMFNFLSGKAPVESNLVKQFELLGEVTGRLHEHVKRWDLSKKLQRPNWDLENMLGKNPHWGHWQDGFGLTPEITGLLQRTSGVIWHRLENFGKKPDRYGLVHADLRLSNLLIEDEKIKVIDFDDCGFSWYLYDLGSALSFIEHKDYVPDLIESWLDGYRKVLPVAAEQEAEIPTFIMLRRLILLAWLGSHSTSDTAKEVGTQFTDQTAILAEKYLLKYS